VDQPGRAPLEKAAARGNPSLVWREGQTRRLEMVRRWLPEPRTGTDGLSALDVGCGIGMYTAALSSCCSQVVGLEVETERAAEAREAELTVVQGMGERLPFRAGTFDLVFSHEVLEHVRNDVATAAEMVRVARPGGRVVVFCPNRWYPFETHGHYWRGEYHFGNTPLINYLPDRLRDRLAPHVRAYSPARLRALFANQPVRELHHTQIYPGYDNLVARRPAIGRWLRRLTYFLEGTPLRVLGLSHLLVLEREHAGES
jgi:SAM-dependent methyltransferase